MTMAGSQYLNQIMHIISQSLMIPCYAFLLYFVAVAVVETGALAGEMAREKKLHTFKTQDFLSGLSKYHSKIELYIENSKIPTRLHDVVTEFLRLTADDGSCQKVIAQNLLSHQECLIVKKTAKTELISKMGPLLGLMGTLIPLGPGLVGLGKGDFNMLAQYLIVSFDATIVGIFAGGLTFAISKVRHRWYERYLSDLDAILETIIEVREYAAKTAKKSAIG